MSAEKVVKDRSGENCELCTQSSTLIFHIVAPRPDSYAENCACLCEQCLDQITGKSPVDLNHLRCLNESIWSEIPAVKVLSYRLLTQNAQEGWASDLLDMMYLTEDELGWAKEGLEDEFAIKHLDCNGAQLFGGDTIVLTKDLEVRGANFTAKRGTSVRNIRLVTDNAEQIEGKVNGQNIVILTQFVKK